MNHGRQNFKEKKLMNGFSLLEVMVALALLALSFTSLLLVQGRATNLAGEAHRISIATQLARLQLMECQREAEKKIASVGDLRLEGDFADLGFANFTWECHAPKFNMKTPSASTLEEGFKSKTKDSAKKDVGASSSVSAPFISMITDALGDSVRELVVIIRWSANNVADEMRVVTHVIDLSAMAGLSRMLAQGTKTLEEGSEKKKPEEQPKMPPTRPPMPPVMPPRARL
jgi:prepilin-type N-terminal cleavage/methylation domain-containing protein